MNICKDKPEKKKLKFALKNGELLDTIFILKPVDGKTARVLHSLESRTWNIIIQNNRLGSRGS